MKGTATSNPQITQIVADSSDVRQDPQTHAILGAATEAHRRLGHGFLEAVYQAAKSADEITL